MSKCVNRWHVSLLSQCEYRGRSFTFPTNILPIFSFLSLSSSYTSHTSLSLSFSIVFFSFCPFSRFFTLPFNLLFSSSSSLSPITQSWSIFINPRLFHFHFGFLPVAFFVLYIFFHLSPPFLSHLTVGTAAVLSGNTLFL